MSIAIFLSGSRTGLISLVIVFIVFVCLALFRITYLNRKFEKSSGFNRFVFFSIKTFLFIFFAFCALEIFSGNEPLNLGTRFTRNPTADIEGRLDLINASFKNLNNKLFLVMEQGHGQSLANGISPSLFQPLMCVMLIMN